MAKPWDDMMKRIFAARPQDFVKWLLPGAMLLSKASLELKTLTRTVLADTLYKVLLDGQEILLHVEFQKYPKGNMAKRVWEYNVLASLEYGCPVYSLLRKENCSLSRSPLLRWFSIMIAINSG